MMIFELNRLNQKKNKNRKLFVLKSIVYLKFVLFCFSFSLFQYGVAQEQVSDISLRSLKDESEEEKKTIKNAEIFQENFQLGPQMSWIHTQDISSRYESKNTNQSFGFGLISRWSRVFALRLNWNSVEFVQNQDKFVSLKRRGEYLKLAGLYYYSPVEFISLYGGIGLGWAHYEYETKLPKVGLNDFTKYDAVLGEGMVGLEYSITSNFNLAGELLYHRPFQLKSQQNEYGQLQALLHINYLWSF